MAVKTLLERIEEVQEAISAVLTSQNLTTQAGSVERARLDFLVNYEKELLNQYALINSAPGGTMNKVRFTRPR